jgi:hypothetical protein
MVIPNIIRDRYLLVVFSASWFLLVLNLILVYLQLGDITTPLIIHFDVYKGIDFLGSRKDVFGILASGATMLLINLLLAEFFYRRERFLSYILTFLSLILSILILIATSVIVSVN